MATNEEISRKRKVRGAHRSSVTRILSNISELLPGSTEKLELTNLRQKKSALSENSQILKRLDEELLIIIPDDELEGEVEQADLIQERIQLAILEIDDALSGEEMSSHEPQASLEPSTDKEQLPSGISPSPRGDTMATSDTIITALSIPTEDTTETALRPSEDTGFSRPDTVPKSESPKVKLPKIDLKRFNGDLTHWTSFWESFESAVDKNSSLSNVDKFNYLNSLLERSAADAVAGLALTSANYMEAIAILKKRYGNKQLIINRHMEILLKLEPVTSPTNLRALRTLYDRVESHVRGLKSLGVSAGSYGSLLSSVLMEKLPSELRLIISRAITEDQWDLETLLQIVEREIDARERSAGIVHSHTAQQRRMSKEQPTTSTLISAQGMTCVYCNESHVPSLCRKIVTVEARKESLRSGGRCYICLRRGHLAKRCRSRLNCNHCQGRHHSSICNQGNSLPRRTQPTTLPDSTQTSNSPPTTSMYIDSRKPVLLQTASVVVFNTDDPTKTSRIRLILDSGSQRSYITTRIKDTLNLAPVTTEKLSIKTFGSTKETQQVCETVVLGIKTKNHSSEQFPVLVVTTICGALDYQPTHHSSESYDHLKGLDLADPLKEDDESLTVDLLIGSDVYWRLVTGEVRRGTSGPVAIATKIGWVLSGPTNIQETSFNFLLTESVHLLHVTSHYSSTLESQLEKFWDLETMGITKEEPSIIQDKFCNSLKFQNNRYEARLPWKSDHPELEDNLKLSKQRLIGLLSRLRRNPALIKEYNAIIQEQLHRGIVQPVTDHETSNRVHYIPHHAVIRKDKSTTKVRIVYDASAKGTNGISLNDCLERGPKFDQCIMEILLRFRIHRVALTADIEKAFLMVSIAKQDQDVLRFLWIDSVESLTPRIIPLKFTRVVFGLTSSPFLLNATLDHHVTKYQEEDPEYVNKFKKSIYVDDLVSGAGSIEEAYQFYNKSKIRLRDGGFTLRKFVTNSIKLNELIQVAEMKPSASAQLTEVTQDDQGYAKTILGGENQTSNEECRVLGVAWDKSKDKLIFDLKPVASLAREIEPTRRNVVCLAAKVYDPLGLISPITTKVKTLFQSLCKAKLHWDHSLTGDFLKAWTELTTALSIAKPIVIDRQYLPSPLNSTSSQRFSLHGFCDASKAAYAAVVYLRVETDSGTRVNILSSKTRVAPLSSTQTIPRLELLSAVLLARLIKTVSSALESEISWESITCYTDSRVALAWIRGVTKQWKQFVENRVIEIRRLTPTSAWNHCPGKENPADLPSRGLDPEELRRNTLWWSGPAWLTTGEPTNLPALEGDPLECLSELKGPVVPMLLVSEGQTTSRMKISNIIEARKFTSLSRLYRVTANVLKFVRRSKKITVSTNEKYEGRKEAEKVWLHDCQSYLSQEPNYQTWQTQFGFFKDDSDLIRCGGRLENADIPFETKHPLMLSPHHPLCELIIKECHEKVKHNGVRETLAQFRSKFWVVRARSLIRKVIYQCVVCRKLEGQSYGMPPPPPLPHYRVNEAQPFQHTGLDFAGPLFIRAGNKESEKVWICLYTCCVTRAIHLDLVVDLHTGTFLNCFRRFVGRRGLPMHLVSDNGKTFKAAAAIIKKIWTNPDVQTHFAGMCVKWTFNLE